MCASHSLPSVGHMIPPS